MTCFTVITCFDHMMCCINLLQCHKQGRQENFWAPVQKETWPPPPILQIMILKLSQLRCVISKESVQQNELMNCDL